MAVDIIRVLSKLQFAAGCKQVKTLEAIRKAKLIQRHLEKKLTK